MSRSSPSSSHYHLGMLLGRSFPRKHGCKAKIPGKSAVCGSAVLSANLLPSIFRTVRSRFQLPDCFCQMRAQDFGGGHGEISWRSNLVAQLAQTER